MNQPSRWQMVIVLIVGIVGVSLAAIWIRLAIDTVNPDNKIGFSLFLAASRLLVVAVVLLPSWYKFTVAKITRTNLAYGIAAGICLAIHFATWITSLAYTSIAVSTVLVTTNPIWVGLFNWWWYQENLTRRHILGIAIALSGGVIIALADSQVHQNYANSWLGNLLAVLGAIMSSLYLIFGSQAQRQGLSTTNYIAIAYSVAAVVLLPLPLLAHTSYFAYPVSLYCYVILMAVFAQGIGHTSLNWLIRWLSPTAVSLSLLFEPVVASGVGAIIFQEIPPKEIALGGMTILVGVMVFLSDFSRR